jgi:hypothetical protein
LDDGGPEPESDDRGPGAAAWPAVVPDRARSVAVLTGTASHVVPGTLPALPQAAAGVAALAAALTGPQGVLDPSAVHTRVDPTAPADVLNLFPAPGAGPFDLCLFYFAGHGVRAEGDRLCLALPGSVDDERAAERTSLPAAAVFQAMRMVRAEHKVAILDCCFAGRALDIPDAADIHLLAAAGRVRKARTPPGSRYPGFTGALLSLLTEGVPDGPAHLDLGTLYRRLAVRLPAADLPEPLQRAYGTTGDLALARNRAHGTGTTRAGLLSRARFAEQTRKSGERDRPRRLAQAVELFAGIASDAGAAFGPTDRDTLRYRHAHATAVGTAGAAGRACALLERIVADWDRAAPADDADARRARASRDYWSNHR